MLSRERKKIIKIIILNLMICLAVQLLLPKNDLKYEMIWRYIVSFIFSYCVYKGTEEDKLLNPYILFSLTPLSLMIYSSEVSTYFLMELQTKTWLLAILNMIVFLVGLNFALKWKVKTGKHTLFKERHLVNNESEIDYTWQGIILFTIGLIPKLISVLGVSIPGAHIISMCQYLGIAVVYTNKNKKLAYIMAIILLGLSFITNFNKTEFLMLAVLFIACIDSRMNTKKEKKKLYITIIFLALTMILIIFPLKDFLARGESLSKFISSDKDYLANEFIGRFQWKKNIKLLMPYIYMTTNWTNLQYITHIFTQHTNGLWLIKPLLGYLQISGGIKAYTSLTPYRPAFNTYSFIAVQYIDFGFFGSMLPSLLLGLFVGWIYKNYKKYPDSFNCACYALNAVAVFEMFFSNHFFTQSYPFTIVIVAWVCSKTIMQYNSRREVC